MRISNVGLTAFQIKVMALLLMLLDHIDYYYGGTGLFAVPGWFSWVGRLAAPLFLFMAANGMRYTHNPKKHVLILYLCGVLMYFGNGLFNHLFPLPNQIVIFNGIFQTIACVCMIIYGFQMIEHNPKSKKKWLGILLILLPLIGSVIDGILLSDSSRLPLAVSQLIYALVPSALACEGSFFWVILGVGFYFCGENKRKITIFYLLFCLAMMLMHFDPEIGLTSLFVGYNQWFMVFALPLMLLYNGKRGRRMKAFFYAFYPAHIYLLAISASLLSHTAG